MTKCHSDRRVSVAPMMDRTDRHFRYLVRLISRHTLLYTEMVHTNALLRGDRERLLAYHPSERPLALQLGGSDPQMLGVCAQMAEDYGYDEVNLNVGCPSERVQQGRFGACLMAEPQLVALCVETMAKRTALPVTVKTRLGIDEQDSSETLYRFIDDVAGAGCHTIILHARKAWLKGLSPKENREIPPLRYEVVHAVKRNFPDLEVVINGGLSTLAQVEEQLTRVDGVMIGREAYRNPYMLAEVDRRFFGAASVPLTRAEVLAGFEEYIHRDQGMPFRSMMRPILGLFQGQSGARRWRQALSAGNSGLPDVCYPKQPAWA